MYFALRPGLRGSHRVLRCIYGASNIYTRPITRSFSSFMRLQSQSPPPNHTDHSLSHTGHQSHGGSRSRILPASIIESFRLLPEEHKQLPGSLSWTEYKLLAGSDEDPSYKKLAEESARIDQYLTKGEVPPEFLRVDSIDQLPAEWKDSLEGNDTLPYPFLVRKDLNGPLITAVTPEEHGRVTDGGENLQNDIAKAFDLQRRVRKDEDTTQTTTAENLGPRKARMRNIKRQQSPTRNVPEWFLKNNVLLSPGLTKASDQSRAVIRSSRAVQLQESSGDIVTIEQQKPEPVTTEKEAPDADAAQPEPQQSASNLSASTEDARCLEGRYYVDKHQYEEVRRSIVGRIKGMGSKAKSRPKSFGLNHLTINHCSNNADSLLAALVWDIAVETKTNLVSVDIQDIAQLCAVEAGAVYAKGGSVPSILQEGANLSYRVYKDVFSASATPRNTEKDMDEEEDDEEDEEDDEESGHGRDLGSMISNAIVLPGIDIGKKMGFGALTSGKPKDFWKFSGWDNQAFSGDADRSIDTIKSIIEPILAAPSQLARSQLASGDEPVDQNLKVHTPLWDKDVSFERIPTIVHIANYRAIQQDPVASTFLGELVSACNRRINDGQRFVIVGTDCMRDLQLDGATPQSILEEQEKKSFGVSSNIVLTPVFPAPRHEDNLQEDQSIRLKMVNLRHLWTALDSKGVPLRGLQPGFWKDDPEKILNLGDHQIIPDTFWNSIHVQRLAAIMAAGSNKEPLPITNASKILSGSDDSKVAWVARMQAQDTSKTQLGSKSPTRSSSDISSKLSKIRRNASKHEKRLLSGVIEPRRITTTFSDIHIPPATVTALQTLTTLSLLRPEAFTYGVLKSDRIPGLLLYGPPGTGKTLAAKAVARESGATMLEVSGADLNDMYVGEGEKNVQALFSLARKLSPCVVFLDEADAIFSTRSGNSGGGRRSNHRELLNQFLREWDGMSNDSGSAFLMVATNRPMDLDDAVLRRLPRRLLVDLPTEKDRLEILKIHLRNETLAEDVDIEDLARRTPFYSGSDLKNVAVAAALEAVREETEAAKAWGEARQVKQQEAQDAQTTYSTSEFTAPTSTTDQQQEEYTFPAHRILTPAHFTKALDEISSSISEDMSSLREIKKFDEQYGDKRGRKDRKRAGGLGFVGKEGMEQEKKRERERGRVRALV